MLAGLLAAVAASPVAAALPEGACGPFAPTEPLVLPREALVVRTLSLGAGEVLLNGDCVSRRARVRRRRHGRVHFVAVFAECGDARRIKVRGGTDAACSAMHGRLVVRHPRFRARFEAVPASTHDCGADGLCEPGSFCELPPGDCGGSAAAGTCVPLPEACLDVLIPVCGCDGVTYGNDCERQASGVSLDHDGPCETPECHENAECSDDTAYCAKRPGDCDGAGRCQPRLLPCPPAFAPVCGCDGESYDNACQAASLGVNVAHDGPCGQQCGGIAGLPCPDAVDLDGICVPTPSICPELYLPVCGCDGVTYGNECERIAAGAQKDHDGPCECPDLRCPPDTLPIDTDHDGCPDDCLSARCETNADCPDDRWCTNDGGDCAGPGYCQERPLGCPDVWLPVCGCDGETYSNECDAAAAGVRVAHQGACLCEPPICPEGQVARDTDFDGCPDRCVPIEGETCGTIAGLGCPDGEVCDLEPGSCQVADAAGRCVPKPEVCPELYAPVCGCDGVTYGNDCERLAAGATKDHDGACDCKGMCCPPVEAACESACDCYAKLGMSFCEVCPLLCPNCGEYWQCEQGRCVEACGPLPPGVITCLPD
jgi:hypothetical protein